MKAEAFWSATPAEQRAHRALESLPNKIARVGARLQARFIDLVRPPPPIESSPRELSEVMHRARIRTDISDHLLTLFTESLALEPRLIVELGVRDGESTFVFERVAKLSGAKCVSVDTETCPHLTPSENRLFVQSDDIEFARRFPEWCAQMRLPERIDILFIDTSHFFEHTTQEIAHWFPFLAPRARVFFHDTNQRRIYFRKDGSMGVAWSNRGVMAALEKYFGRTFNEKEDFTVRVDDWSITHHANCNGLTILTRGAAGARANNFIGPST